MQGISFLFGLVGRDHHRWAQLFAIGYPQFNPCETEI